MTDIPSLLRHTKNRVIDQRSLMTCLPTADVESFMEIAREKLERDLKKADEDGQWAK